MHEDNAVRPVEAIVGCSTPDARAYIKGIVEILTDDDFIETLWYPRSPTDPTQLAHDVYGYIDGDRHWYIKFKLCGPFVVVSFHAPTREDTTRGGTTIRPPR